jgi:hypothetical protein
MLRMTKAVGYEGCHAEALEACGQAFLALVGVITKKYQYVQW